MSYFGEISEPSSRTAWEDWDEVPNKETIPVLSLKEEYEVPDDIDTFLIFEGRFFYDLVKVQRELEHINAIPEVNLHLYKSKTENIYICVIKDYDLVQSSEVVELLKDFITKSKDVVGVLTKPLVEYQVAQLVTKDHVIRSLYTTNQISRRIDSSYPNLEQPNIIAGVAAGALCLREIIDKPAAVLVCYIDYLEEHEVQALQEILEKYKIIPYVDRLKRSNVLNSNLYI